MRMKHGSEEPQNGSLRATLLRNTPVALFEHSPDLCVVISQSGEIVEINPSGAELLGLPAAQLAGTDFFALFADSAGEETTRGFCSAQHTSGKLFTTALTQHPQGQVSVEMFFTPVHDRGACIGFYISARDITERVSTEHTLRETEAQYRTFYTDHPDPIFTLDAAGCFQHMNPAAEDLLGHSGHYLIGQPLLQFIVPELREHTAHMFQQALKGRVNRHETTVVIAGTRVVHLAISAVRRGTQITPLGLHCIARDISRERQVSADLQRMAYIDFRTDLPNRYGLDRDLERLVAENTPFSLITADLDRFKNVNDSWGRETGDQMIRCVADHLRSQLPENATVYRYTGDQFFIVLRTCDPNVARDFATQLQGLFIEPFAANGHSIRTTISSGAASFPTDAADTETLVKNAEFALIIAKQQGRNRVVWHADIEHTERNEHAQLALELREAAVRGELSLTYQPQVDVRTQQPFGAEALLRWTSPRFGLVPPDRFIPIAEQGGLIVEIGSWALRQACTQFARWLAEGYPLPHISVNISMHQFYDPGFIGVVSDVLADSGLQPGQLVLEVTESVASQHESVVQRMNEVRRLGVHLALDDFGTGFSSLTTLQEFPLDYLKVDRSFVQHLNPEHPRGLAATVLTLTQSLGLKSIAEGVETEAQLLQLTAMGADVVQGYHIARPLTATQMTEWLRAR